MDLGLSGKVVMVAGASRGLGNAIAHALQAEGARVSVSSSDTRAIAQAGEALPGSLAMLCNVRDPLQIQAWVEATREHFGAIDALVVNAGGPPPGGFGDFADEDWQAAFEFVPEALVAVAGDIPHGQLVTLFDLAAPKFNVTHR